MQRRQDSVCKTLVLCGGVRPIANFNLSGRFLLARKNAPLSLLPHIAAAGARLIITAINEVAVICAMTIAVAVISDGGRSVQTRLGHIYRARKIQNQEIDMSDNAHNRQAHTPYLSASQRDALASKLHAQHDAIMQQLNALDQQTRTPDADDAPTTYWSMFTTTPIPGNLLPARPIYCRVRYYPARRCRARQCPPKAHQ